MGGRAQQLKPHNNLPGMGGNSLNPLQNLPKPGQMPGLGGQFGAGGGGYLPGFGGGGGGDGGGGEDQKRTEAMMNMRAAQENGTETPQMEAQRLMAGMPNLPQQAVQAMQKQGAQSALAGGMPPGGGMGSAGGGLPGQQINDWLRNNPGGAAGASTLMGGAGGAAGAPQMPTAPAALPNQIAQGLGGPQAMSAAAMGNAPAAVHGKKLNPGQAQKMAGMLGGAPSGGRIR
jgi:hypothetical protein